MKLSYVFMALVAAVYFEEALVDADLCTMMQGYNPTHTSCATPSSDLLSSSVPSQADISEILEFHNSVRNYVDRDIGDGNPSGMLAMTWDYNLEEEALKLAETCVYAHDGNNQRELYGKFSVGQNLAIGAPTMTYGAAMQLWYDEVTLLSPGYDYSGYVKSGTGHYTAMIWDWTYKVGCASAICSPASRSDGAAVFNGITAEYVVCNYGPAGNMYGDRPYAIGTPNCAASPSAYPNVCQCDESIVCYGNKRINPATCECECGNAAFDANCFYDCNNNVVTDQWYCGTQWPKSYCTMYSNVPGDCPNMCNCPLENPWYGD